MSTNLLSDVFVSKIERLLYIFIKNTLILVYKKNHEAFRNKSHLGHTKEDE